MKKYKIKFIFFSNKYLECCPAEEIGSCCCESLSGCLDAPARKYLEIHSVQPVNQTKF